MWTKPTRKLHDQPAISQILQLTKCETKNPQQNQFHFMRCDKKNTVNV